SWSSAAVLIFEAASHSGLVGGLLRSVGISGMRGSTRGSGAALAGADAAPEAVTEAAASSGAALADSDGAGGAASPGAAWSQAIRPLKATRITEPQTSAARIWADSQTSGSEETEFRRRSPKPRA